MKARGRLEDERLDAGDAPRDAFARRDRKATGVDGGGSRVVAASDPVAAVRLAQAFAEIGADHQHDGLAGRAARAPVDEIERRGEALDTEERAVVRREMAEDGENGEAGRGGPRELRPGGLLVAPRARRKA